MKLHIQELIVASHADWTTLTVQTPARWKYAIGVVLTGCAGYGWLHPSTGIAAATAASALALLLTFFAVTLGIYPSRSELVLRSGVGPLGISETIPFESIKIVTFSDGGTATVIRSTDMMGNPVPNRPIYSLAVEIQGKKHVHLKTLLSGVPTEELIREARHLGDVCGKPVFIPSALQ